MDRKLKTLNRKKFYRLFAAGLLIMNLGTMSNLLLNTTISIDFLDFLKGVGMVFVLFASYKIIGGKKICF